MTRPDWRAIVDHPEPPVLAPVDFVAALRSHPTDARRP
jgi:hypothetical protein